MKKLLPVLCGCAVVASGLLYYSNEAEVSFLKPASLAEAEATAYTPQEIWEQEYARKQARRLAGYGKSDKPNEYSKYERAIRTKWGEQRPDYPAGYRTMELQKAVSARKNSNNIRTATLDWVERGPGNVPGRTRAILVLPGDQQKNTWLAGSVAGGIWKTTDAGQNWVNKTPGLSNMGTTTLAMSASDPAIIYAGTGESFADYQGISGDGIIKSKDGGETWTPIASTVKNANFKNVNRLLVDQQDANKLVVATTPGFWGSSTETSKLMKSVDGGVNWRVVYSSLNPIEQVVADPSNFSIQYATVNSVGVIKSVDAGETWQKTADLDITGRVELAIAPSNPDRIYAVAVGNINGKGSDMYVSDDGATTWRLIKSMSGSDYDYLGEQGWYNNVVAVNPFNANEVYVGGVDMFRIRTGANSASTPTILGVDQNGTQPFLNFVSFDANYFKGQLEKGTATENLFSSVEVRFGPGLKQKAHRFFVPQGASSGVPAANYTYQDYVEVPFQVWDVQNNRQLMVSFRDQERDGVFNLKDRQYSNEELSDNREYIYIHGVEYKDRPDAYISVSGGHEIKQLYFFWPTLTVDGTWNPQNLPLSNLKINYGARMQMNAEILVNCDAYNRFSGLNRFSQITNETAVSGVHPDHHALVMVPMNEANKTFKIINGNDGGVYVSNVSTAPGTLEGEWSFAGLGYNTTQFYGVDKKPGANEYIGGTQDNGTWKTPIGTSASATTKYQRALGGDGFEVVWHYDNPVLMLGTSYNNQIYKTRNGGGSWRDASRGITDKDDKAPFITKLGYNKSRPDVVYAVGEQGVWVSEDFAETWKLTKISSLWTVGSFMDIEVSASNPKIVWTGSGMFKDALSFHVSTDGGKNFKPTKIYNTETLGVSTGIFTHPTEDSTAYALFSYAKSPKILKTTDLGETWTDISGFEGRDISVSGFPDVAVYTLLVMPHNPNHIWVGTEIGLVESLDNGKTWGLANNGLPSTSIWDLKAVDEQVIVGTHGRGIWSLDLPELPEIVRIPHVASVTPDGEGQYKVRILLRSQYDSLQVTLQDQRVLSVIKSDQNEITVTIPASEGQGELSLKAVGYVRKVDHPSKAVLLNVTGFEDDVLENKLAFTAYPNPSTQGISYLNYNLPSNSKVKIKVWSMTGALVDELNLGMVPAGKHVFPYLLPKANKSMNLLIVELITEQGTKRIKLVD